MHGDILCGTREAPPLALGVWLPNSGKGETQEGTAVMHDSCSRLSGSAGPSCCGADESTPEERSAANPHATFCGSRARVTASGTR